MTTEQRLLVILEGIKNELHGIREAMEPKDLLMAWGGQTEDERKTESGHSDHR